MATDIAAILTNLTTFYRFAGKSVIHVGAGGGQLIGYAKDVRCVVAVDSDLSAVGRLHAAIGALGLQNRFTVVHGELGPELDAADVVLFEFCLHEMADPQTALKHAQSLAPAIVVIDHDPRSKWAWYTAETEKARRSWAAVEQWTIRNDQQFVASQRFSDARELVQRVSTLGEPAVSRAQALAGQVPIEIEMAYRIALL
jgi:hypothetical protein